jgi:acyl carrier protein
MNENPVDVVLGWVRENRLKVKHSGQVLTPDTPLQGTGLLDSMAFLDLVTYLEQHFGIRVDEDDMEPANFEDARAVARLMERLMHPG